MIPPPYLRPRPAGVLAALAVLLAAGPAAAQSTYTWNTATPLGAWLDTANWSGTPSGRWPGVTTAASGSNGNARDLALIDNYPLSGAGPLAIDMIAAGSGLSVGAIHFAAASQSAVTLGSSNGSGTLRLNGAATPVAGVANVVLANTTGASNLTIVNATNGGNQLLTVRLGTPDGVVLVNGGRSITVDAAVAEAAAGSGITLRGGGGLTLNSSVGYTGATHVMNGALTFGSGGTGTIGGAVRNDGWVAYNRAGTSALSGNLSGAGNWGVRTGAVTLTGTNTHTGTTYILSTASGFNPGGVVLGSAAAAGGADARYHFHLPGSTVAAAYPIDQGVLARIDPASRGYVQMRADSANALDFSALPNVSLSGDGSYGGAGPAVPRTFSGTLVPHATGYRLGGGTGVLTVASALGGDVPLTVTGQVTLSGANTYTGPTVIDPGAELRVVAVNDGNTPGPLGASSAAAGNLVLRGGTLVKTGSAATTDRGLTLVGGGSVTGNGSLTFGGDLVRTPGATLNIPGGGAIGLTTVNGVPIGSVPVNGVIPWASINSAVAGWDGTRLVAVGADYFTILPPGTDNPIMNAQPTARVDAYGRTAAQTVTADLTINSLRMGQEVTVNAGARLTVASGAVFLNGGDFLGGGEVTSGYVTGGTAELFLHGPSSLQAVVQTAVVDNGGTPVRLVKAGPGGLSLARANTHSGGTTVNGGTVFLDHAAGLGTGPATVNPGGAGVVARVGGTIANPITVPAGGTAVLGTTGVTAAAAGETRFTGAVTVDRPVTLQAGNVNGTRFSGTFSGTGDVTITNNAFAGLFYRVVFDATGTNNFGNLYLAQNATLQLGNTTDSGNRQIPDAANVYFAPGSAVVIRRSTSAVATAADGEAVNALISQAPGAGTITVFENGSVPGTTFTLTVGAGNGSGEFGGRLMETGAPPRLALVKAGTGTQVLSAANAYTGGTTVSAGTLLVNNAAGSGVGTGAVMVEANGTLGGNGIVSPAAAGFTGTVVAGTLTAGTAAGDGRNDLALVNGLNMLAGSRYVVRVFDTGPADASLVTVSGSATVSTGAIVLDLAGVDPDALRAAVGVGNSRVYTVMTATNLGGTGFTAGGFTTQNGPGFLPGEWAFDSFDTTNDRVTIRFSPVPEPAAVLAVAAAGLAAGWASRRRGRTGSGPP